MLSQAAIKRSERAAPATVAAAMGAARLTRLCVTDFRSYANADIRFDGRPVAIAGANGAGKTNLLEAISLVGPGRGVRGARLEELPRIGGPGGWAVSLRVDDGEDERRFGVGAEAARPDRRVCRIDDAPASGPGVFSEHLRFLWLTPAMDRLFMEGAGERRKFLDRMTLAHEPSHGKQSSAYEQAMRQRQRLLDEGETDDRWLSALEAQMAEAGVAIAAARRNMVERLSKADVADGDEFFPAADIVLDGEIEAALASQEVSNVEADYLTELRRRRRLDADAGRALAGPHRSDLLVSHREKNRAAKLCSTGEQKALLIGLVLANARALSANGGAPLILLLDEIAAHLDPDRRAGLFTIVGDLGFQAFMTGTDRDLFTAWGDGAQHFEAREGVLKESTPS